jgi:hypothetical protein
MRRVPISSADLDLFVRLARGFFRPDSHYLLAGAVATVVHHCCHVCGHIGCGHQLAVVSDCRVQSADLESGRGSVGCYRIAGRGKPADRQELPSKTTGKLSHEVNLRTGAG